MEVNNGEGSRAAKLGSMKWTVAAMVYLRRLGLSWVTCASETHDRSFESSYKLLCISYSSSCSCSCCNCHANL